MWAPADQSLGPPSLFFERTTTQSVTLPITTASTDPTAPNSNFRGYQIDVTPQGAASAFCAGVAGCVIPPVVTSGPFTFPPAGRTHLPGANTPWGRALDWSG